MTIPHLKNKIERAKIDMFSIMHHCVFNKNREKIQFVIKSHRSLNDYQTIMYVDIIEKWKKQLTNI